MSGESFASRVQALRSSWIERRQVKALASAHDFDSQFRLLLTLYSWTRQAVADVRHVYGDALRVVLSPQPRREAPGFTISIDQGFSLTFALNERRRGGASRWFVAVSVSSSGPGGGAVAAGPERRNGVWTRGRLEDLLLSVLGAYERSVSDGEPPLPFGRESSASAG